MTLHFALDILLTPLLVHSQHNRQFMGKASWFGDKYAGNSYKTIDSALVAPSVSELSDRRRNSYTDGVRGASVDGVLAPLLLMVRLITSAFVEAREIDPDTGNPSADARRAYQWLMRDPFSKYRTEPGSFAAFCSALGPEFDRKKVRERGTPAGSYCYKDTEGGIAAIRQVWNKAKFEWYISGGPKKLAASEALLEQIKLKKRARETGQMVLTMEIAVPACAGR